MNPETLKFGLAVGFIRLRRDGRHEVADHAIANELYGCAEWWHICCLARDHDGPCEQKREVESGRDRFYLIPSLRERCTA